MNANSQPDGKTPARTHPVTAPRLAMIFLAGMAFAWAWYGLGKLFRFSLGVQSFGMVFAIMLGGRWWNDARFRREIVYVLAYTSGFVAGMGPAMAVFHHPAWHPSDARNVLIYSVGCAALSVLSWLYDRWATHREEQALLRLAK